MNLSDPLGTLLATNDAKVLRVLSRLEAPISGRHVHRLSGDVSYSGIRLALERLARTGLVVATPLAHAVMYSVNRQHLLWPPVRSMLESKTRLATQIRDHLSTEVDDALTDLALSFYGSVARADSSEQSDIDLVVVYVDERQRDTCREAVGRLLDEIETWTGNSAQLYDITRKELEDMVAANDPIVDSWVTESDAIVGPEMAALCREVLG